MGKDVEESSIADTTASSPNVETTKESSNECKICGAQAEHSNYGLRTCSPCKMFFRRNAITGQEKFTCDFGGQCEININNRHVCPACRLNKCFANGMQPDLIRYSSTNKNTSKSQKQNKESEPITAISNILATIDGQNQLQQFPTLNLLQSDNSTLYSNQWTLLSNLIYSYDETELLSIARKFINEANAVQSTITIDSTLAKEFFMQAYETAGGCLRSNGDLYTLSCDDRSAFLLSAAECVICIGTIFCLNQSQLYNCQSFLTICKNIYGEASVDMIQHILRYIDPDSVTVKLALSLFTFCNNISIFSPMITIKPINTLAIHRIQNTYAEVTWKYLVHKYGYYQSIQRFMQLIQFLLAATDSIYDAQNILIHVNDVETLIEKTELALIIDDIERIDEIKN